MSLCTAFPTLFDLVDESATMEVDGVAKEDYWKVVDQCYLCDMCYMTKCPYVPPHPWNVDFPHLMLRAKAVKFKQGRDELPRPAALLAPTRSASSPTIPVVVQIGELRRTRTPLRAARCEKVARRAQGRASCRRIAPTQVPRARAAVAAVPGDATASARPGKVAIFATCYVNYNEPGIGHDLLADPRRTTRFPYVLVEKEACCGMPKLELGDLEAVDAAEGRSTSRVLAELAREGYAILDAGALLHADVQAGAAADVPGRRGRRRGARRDVRPVRVPGAARRKDGLLKTDFKQPLGKVSYHIPCHSRVQNMGQKTREMLEAVPGTEVNTVERCSGHDGTWGVKDEYFEHVDEDRPPGVPPDGRARSPTTSAPTARSPAATSRQGIDAPRRSGKAASCSTRITLLRMAYGLPD